MNHTTAPAVVVEAATQEPMKTSSPSSDPTDGAASREQIDV
jgi:hypothetical protein